MSILNRTYTCDCHGFVGAHFLEVDWLVSNVLFLFCEQEI